MFRFDRAPSRTFTFCVTSFTLLAGLAGAAHAQSGPLVQGDGVAITSADMQADALRMPQEMRDLVLSDVRKVSQIAENLYVRRALAEQAAKAGMDQDVATKAALQVARDKVLSDAMLTKMDAENKPSDAATEAMARTAYRASPDRFKRKEQVHVRHILLSKDGPSARADAEAVLAKLRGGADFATLAKELSKDPGSATKVRPRAASAWRSASTTDMNSYDTPWKP